MVAAAASSETKPKKMVKVKKNNSNALVVHMSSLSENPLPHSGGPWFCQGCTAAISSLSKVTKVDETTSWTW